MITTIIFDMDGVLINSQSVLDIIEFKFINQLTGDSWSSEDQKSIHGKSIDEVYQLLVEKYKISISKANYLKTYDSILEDTYKDKCFLNAGVKGFLEDIHSNKYNIALASSTEHRFINLVLRRFKLNSYFKVIASGEDVIGKGKPEPDIFLRAAKKMGVEPGNCLVIEDSESGIKAAKRAGMYCIEYLAGNIEKKITFADLFINSFKGVDIHNLCTRVAGANIEIESLIRDGKKYYFQLSDKVNKSDYYSDFLLTEISNKLIKLNKLISLLEIGTGRGYLPIILASKFPQVFKIIGVDMDDNAVSLAKKNVWLNGLDSRIEIRKGNLFSTVKKGEKFDIIFGAPPQIPITKKEMLSFMKKNGRISNYHLTTSVGGANGQELLKRIIKNSARHLLKDGLLIEVQADFSWSQGLGKYAHKMGFSVQKQKKKQKLLSETTLTRLLEQHLNHRGYIFKKNDSDQKYFNLICIVFTI